MTQSELKDYGLKLPCKPSAATTPGERSPQQKAMQVNIGFDHNRCYASITCNGNRKLTRGQRGQTGGKALCSCSLSDEASHSVACTLSVLLLDIRSEVGRYLNSALSMIPCGTVCVTGILHVITGWAWRKALQT